MTLPLSVLGQQFIVRRRVAGGEATLSSQRTTDGGLTGYHFYPTSCEGVVATAEAVDQVFPVYSRTTPDVRARFLGTIADELGLFGEDFFVITHQETALSLARSQGERTCTSNQPHMPAGVLRRGSAFGVRIDTTLPDHQPLPRPDLRQFLTALGPVAVFGTSNFPLTFSTAGDDTASTLAAGYPVAARARPGHMATARLTAQAIMRAVATSGLPVSVFNMTFGTDIDTDLARHSATRAVGFIGSLRDDKAFWQLAQQRPQPIPAFAKVSAINPLIILPQAVATRAEMLASKLVSSFTLGCGQFRTKPGLILVLRDEGMPCFTQALKVVVDLVPAQIMLNAPTLVRCEEGVSALEVCSHIQRLAGSSESVIDRAQIRLHQAPASLLLAQDPLLQQEVFDPLAMLIEAADETELQPILRVIPDQLITTIYTGLDDRPLAQCLLPTLTEKVGHVLFNGYPTGVEVCDAMVHDGPWPATADAHGISVGIQFISRFLRSVCLQNMSAVLLSSTAQDDDPLNLLRLISGQWT